MTYKIYDANVIAETEKAILVEAEEFDEPQWIPQSQIDDDSEVWTSGTDGTLIVSDWFAAQRGWV